MLISNWAWGRFGRGSLSLICALNISMLIPWMAPLQLGVNSEGGLVCEFGAVQITEKP